MCFKNVGVIVQMLGLYFLFFQRFEVASSPFFLFLVRERENLFICQFFMSLFFIVQNYAESKTIFALFILIVYQLF